MTTTTRVANKNRGRMIHDGNSGIVSGISVSGNSRGSMSGYEFCSTLNRDTAKIVAFNIQKIAREEGRAVFAATTHRDLFQDLKPSIHIHKRFGREIEVHYYPNDINRECSLVKEMRITEGTKADYKKLAHFHYRDSDYLCTTKYSS